jgi:hypothetical protein
MNCCHTSAAAPKFWHSCKWRAGNFTSSVIGEDCLFAICPRIVFRAIRSKHRIVFIGRDHVEPPMVKIPSARTGSLFKLVLRNHPKLIITVWHSFASGGKPRRVRREGSVSQLGLLSFVRITFRPLREARKYHSLLTMCLLIDRSSADVLA